MNIFIQLSCFKENFREIIHVKFVTNDSSVLKYGLSILVKGNIWIIIVVYLLAQTSFSKVIVSV